MEAKHTQGELGATDTTKMEMPDTFSGLVFMANERNASVAAMFSVLCSEEQIARFRGLLKRTAATPFFKCEGTYFKGDRSIAAIQFMLSNPRPADFSVWLEKNYPIYYPAS